MRRADLKAVLLLRADGPPRFPGGDVATLRPSGEVNELQDPKRAQQARRRTEVGPYSRAARSAAPSARRWLATWPFSLSSALPLHFVSSLALAGRLCTSSGWREALLLGYLALALEL